MSDDLLLANGFEFLHGSPDVMLSAHRHKEIEINLVKSGEMTYLLGGSRQRLPVGQLAVFWATVPHRVIDLAPGTQYYCIHLPLVWFLQWRLPDAFVHDLMHGEMQREFDARWAERDAATFFLWRQDMEDASPETQRVVLLEIEARLWRLAHSSRADSARADKLPVHPPSSGEVNHVERMASYIAQNYGSPVTVARIAHDADLHPKYAMTLFRRHCGMTMGEYLTQQRLSQAQRLLATTDAKVVDVAFEAGFGSVSRFYAVFQSKCGQSPRAYRAGLRG